MSLLEIINVLETYGWALFLLLITAIFLTKYLVKKSKVWNSRYKERTVDREKLLNKELCNHKFFNTINFKIQTEIPTLELNQGTTPVRQKLYRDILRFKLITLHDTVVEMIKTDVSKMTPFQWASYATSSMVLANKRLEEMALKNGVPQILVNKFMVWQIASIEVLNNYIANLAISNVYNNNRARMNTLMYLLELKIITVMGDAERALIELNGEISGLTYEGEPIE